MSVNNGEKANQTVFNSSFVSREVDDNKIGKLDLENTDGASGSSITNVQRELNGQANFVGDTTNSSATRTPVWNSDTIGTPNEAIKPRVDAVQTQVETNTTNITGNTSDIADIRTTTGTSDGDTDMGTYTAGTNGFNVTGGQSTKQNIQDAIDGIDARILLTEKGAADGVATLDSGGRLPAGQLPTSATEYKGAWDANTNSPTLIDGTGTNGDLYRVSVAGTQDLGSGSETYGVGDAIIYNGSIWQKIPADDAVSSVNGNTGIVVLDTDDISEGATNLYHTNGRVDARIALASIDDLSDVDTTTAAPTEGQVLTWDNTGGNWVPGNGGSGSGAGKKNYLEDGVFENGITDASVYDDGGSYVDGTGGSPVEISISQTGFSLAGDNSLAIDKAGSVSAVGEGCTLTTQSIDLIDLGKDLFFQFAYDANDTNYTTDDVILKAYDVTNSAELTVIPIANLTDSGGLFKKLTTAYGKILVNSTTQVVRLSLHVETDTVVSSAWTITVDEAIIGPSSVLVGSVITEWESYTPTGNWSAYGTYRGRYRRIGDSMELDVVWKYSSAPAGSLTVDLPSGFSINFGKLADNGGASSDVDTLGIAWAVDVGVNVQYPLQPIVASGTSIRFVDANATLTDLSNPFSWSTNDGFSMRIIVPINEWSSGNLLSANDASYQTIKVHAAEQTGGALTADTTNIPFGVETLDSHNSWNGTQFTAPYTTTYDVEGLFRATANANRAISAYVNGTLTKTFSSNAYNGLLSKFSGNIYLQKDDVLSFRTDVSETQATGIQSNNWITIESRPDFDVFGIYGETEYKEVILSANTVTTTASTAVDVTGASLPLSPGEWQVGYGATVYLDWVSGSSVGIIGNLRVTDSSNVTQNGSESGCYAIASNSDGDVGHYLTSTINMIVTSPETYKMRLTCNQTNTTAQAFVDVTSGLFGDGIFWARKIK